MTLKYFFANPSIVPKEYLWEAYGPEHICWLILIAVFVTVSCVLFKKADYDRQTKILRAFALLIVVQEILKDILHWYAGTITLEHLPFHICGISIFFTLWHAYRPNGINSDYLYAVSMPGALAALVFPNWTEYPIMHFSAINSFTIHTWLVAYALMVLTSGRMRPDWRNLPKIAAIMIGLMIPIYFLNKRWNTNFMFINGASPGSPLVPLYDIFSDAYFIVAIFLVFVFWAVIYAPWIISDSRKDKKQ